ncbi:hypothetical protein BAY61_18295 [Prauserella marina]|uniref:Anti-anti-sigma factor n=1 Tax=Prauserella marina TaxID=530584 RepID=A0A222VRT3_9PSEU|nr:STAS domain-containing protein [Prauserella marina]ASR36627.1 hypothetical protein BAY61_18295 [Prauserella marina]PWV74042.1 anti-anti-sigma factor [Prauserella marina]SDD61554.1 anti-anti-sigma factor [Prauserella marina]
MTTANILPRQDIVNGLLTIERFPQYEGVWVVSAAGDLDTRTTPIFMRAVREIDAVHPSILVLDLSSVHYLAIGGVRALCAIAEQSRAHRRRLKVVARTHAVRHAIKVCGVVDQVPLCGSRSDALVGTFDRRHATSP